MPSNAPGQLIDLDSLVVEMKQVIDNVFRTLFGRPGKFKARWLQAYKGALTRVAVRTKLKLGKRAGVSLRCLACV